MHMTNFCKCMMEIYELSMLILLFRFSESLFVFVYLVNFEISIFKPFTIMFFYQAFLVLLCFNLFCHMFDAYNFVAVMCSLSILQFIHYVWSFHLKAFGLKLYFILWQYSKTYFIFYYICSVYLCPLCGLISFCNSISLSLVGEFKLFAFIIVTYT